MRCAASWAVDLCMNEITNCVSSKVSDFTCKCDAKTDVMIQKFLGIPYFRFQYCLHCISKTIWRLTVIFQAIRETEIPPRNKCRSLWPTLIISVVFTCLEGYLMNKGHTSNLPRNRGKHRWKISAKSVLAPSSSIHCTLMTGMSNPRLIVGYH